MHKVLPMSTRETTYALVKVIPKHYNVSLMSEMCQYSDTSVNKPTLKVILNTTGCQKADTELKTEVLQNA